ARDASAPGEPLLQDHRRAHRPDRCRHAAEPQDLRGPGHQDVLPADADVTEVANAMRALLQTTRISVNKAENSITLRDTSDKVAVAERIVEQNDKQVAEVVVDVELLQINATKAQNLGTQFAPRAITAVVPAPGGTTNLGAALGS